jgi:hypothetical protein
LYILQLILKKWSTRGEFIQKKHKRKFLLEKKGYGFWEINAIFNNISVTCTFEYRGLRYCYWGILDHWQSHYQTQSLSIHYISPWPRIANPTLVIAYVPVTFSVLYIVGILCLNIVDFKMLCRRQHRYDRKTIWFTYSLHKQSLKLGLRFSAMVICSGC